MKYYNKSDLSKLGILQFMEKIECGKAMDLRQIIVNDLRFVFYDADVFRQGVCQLFAYALHQRFGYKVHIIKAQNRCHIFCKTLDNQYVDVRGMTHSFNEFICGLEFLDIKDDTSEAYSFSDDDFTGAYHNVALAFANAIIEHDVQRYKAD